METTAELHRINDCQINLTNVAVRVHRRKRTELGKRGNTFRRWDEAGSSLLVIVCQPLNQRKTKTVEINRISLLNTGVAQTKRHYY